MSIDKPGGMHLLSHILAIHLLDARVDVCTLQCLLGQRSLPHHGALFPSHGARR